MLRINICDFSQIGLPAFSLGLDLLSWVISLGVKDLSVILTTLTEMPLFLSGPLSTQVTAESSLVVSRIISGLLCYLEHNTWPFFLRSWLYLGVMPRKGNKLSARLLIISTLAEGSIIFYAGGIRAPFLGTFKMSALHLPPTVGNSSLVWGVSDRKPQFLSSWMLLNWLYMSWIISLTFRSYRLWKLKIQKGPAWSRREVGRIDRTKWHTKGKNGLPF